jgi:hypothetical protein
LTGEYAKLHMQNREAPQISTYEFIQLTLRKADGQGPVPAMELVGKIPIVTSDQICTILKALEEITFSGTCRVGS